MVISIEHEQFQVPSLNYEDKSMFLFSVSVYNCMQLSFVNSHKDVKRVIWFCTSAMVWYANIELPLSVFELKFISPYFFLQFHVIQPYLEFKVVNLRYKINYFKIIPLYLCFKCLLFTLLVREGFCSKVMEMTKHITLNTGQMRSTAVY